MMTFGVPVSDEREEETTLNTEKKKDCCINDRTNRAWIHAHPARQKDPFRGFLQNTSCRASLMHGESTAAPLAVVRHARYRRAAYTQHVISSGTPGQAATVTTAHTQSRVSPTEAQVCLAATASNSVQSQPTNAAAAKGWRMRRLYEESEWQPPQE